MRLTSSSSPAGLSTDPPIEDIGLRDPHGQWLRMLAHGAVVSAVGAGAAALWSYLQFAARLRFYSDRGLLESLFSFLTLGSATVNWVGTWLLTAPSPTYDSAPGRGLREKFARKRSALLRLLYTAVFVIWSLRLFGLIGTSQRPAGNELGFWLLAQAIETTAIILLWVHLWALANRLEQRGLGRRALMILIGRGATLLVMGVCPTAMAMAQGVPIRLGWDFLNVRNLLYILWALLAMIVLIRFAISLRRLAVESDAAVS